MKSSKISSKINKLLWKAYLCNFGQFKYRDERTELEIPEIEGRFLDDLTTSEKTMDGLLRTNQDLVAIINSWTSWDTFKLNICVRFKEITRERKESVLLVMSEYNLYKARAEKEKEKLNVS